MADGPETPPNYEEQFAHRFSLQDPEYQQYVSRPTEPPPLVEDWRGRGAGHNRGGRYQDRGGYRGRGWGGDRGRDRDRDRSWGRDRDGDRDRSWGRDRGGHQQWPDRDRGYGQGRGGHQSGGNSYHQRPSNYNRY